MGIYKTFEMQINVEKTIEHSTNNKKKLNAVVNPIKLENTLKYFSVISLTDQEKERYLYMLLTH